jgi:ribosomal protein L11 methyltransferase
VERLFEELGALCVTLGDAANQPLLEPEPGQSPVWQQTRVTGLFAADQDPDLLRSRISLALDSELTRRLQLELLEERVWERAWLDDFHPMQFGQRLWVCPTGQLPTGEGEAVVVTLDPGLAFGTGTHPTTELCLRWLDGAELSAKKVIDFGCGSGILAVAALKLGAQQVLAIDHDPQALDATRANGEKNGVSDHLLVANPETLPDQPVDLLVANILAGTLIELEPLLATLTRPGGSIILSGILSDQAAEVSQAFTLDFIMGPAQQNQDWVLLEGRRR